MDDGVFARDEIVAFYSAPPPLLRARIDGQASDGLMPTTTQQIQGATRVIDISSLGHTQETSDANDIVPALRTMIGVP